MIHDASHFDWPTLTLSCVSERTDTLLSVSAAIRHARDDLERRGASVESVAESDRLHFSWGWFTGRTWLGTIAGGSVQVNRDTDRILVTTKASLWPLLAYSLIPILLLFITDYSWFIGVGLLLFVTSHAVGTYIGLRGIARAALTS